ncbi:sensor domain-containing diguanylate cyclase [Oceanibacterium hippocampi]|uniref:Sensor protein FixL n=1 Tax=Oceanibacterium hippocampi TaxID=745714 RepID=A0A1Y5TXM9_9PROT|nr:diguanylate cyclase [Oceanibacterium hippocampi]SLN76334.1 putative diguanylate cyclase AdrA [Oceanibacterium hippocampi]
MRNTVLSQVTGDVALDALLDSIVDAVILIDEGGIIRRFNKGAERIFGYGRDEALGRNVAMLMPAEHATRHDGYLAQYRETGEARIIGIGREVVARRKDGTELPVVLSVGVLEILGERFFVGNIHDLTVEARLRQLATVDQLTGAFNRGHCLELAAREFNRQRRHGGSIAVLLLDIDRFKSVNDTFGHATGDLALKGFTDACRGDLRDVDIFGRIGGEEFLLILPEADRTQAELVAERLRRATEDIVLPNPDGETFGFTVSIGIACVEPSDEAIENAIRRADAALYRAKAAGRNRVEFRAG